MFRMVSEAVATAFFTAALNESGELPTSSMTFTTSAMSFPPGFDVWPAPISCRSAVAVARADAGNEQPAERGATVGDRAEARRVAGAGLRRRRCPGADQARQGRHRVTPRPRRGRVTSAGWDGAR